MNPTPDLQAYWQRKILRWERVRYSHWLSAYPLSWTIRKRLRDAIAVLRERVTPSESILELGCGTGRLAEALCAKHLHYLGVDFAESAIVAAIDRVRSPGFRFKCENVLTTTIPSTDITVFLGLVDWLQPDQLEALIQKLVSPRLLFSFTQEAKFSPYILYRRWSDRPVSGVAYRARNFSEAEIVTLLGKFGYSYELLSSPSKLNPGRLVWAVRRQ